MRVCSDITIAMAQTPKDVSEVAQELGLLPAEVIILVIVALLLCTGLSRFNLARESVLHLEVFKSLSMLLQLAWSRFAEGPPLP